MKKILVTTDFSSNANAALRFASQLALQNKYKLTFFHSYQINRPTLWSDAVYSLFEKKESAKIKRKLQQFVISLFKKIGFTPENFECVIQSGLLADRNIMEFAAQHNYDFICISRKGDGKSIKLFGTIISKLITQSDVPVIAVPHTYRRRRIVNIAYASDLFNLDQELKKVIDFTEPLGVKVELLHFNVPEDYLTDAKKIEKVIKKLSDCHIKAHIETFDYEKNLIENINRAIKKSRPSVIIMFTEQKRTFFEKLFLSSIAADYSAITKTPLLVFKKT